MIVTEKKKIKIDRTCIKNPFFITWINSKGGREHWLFSRFNSYGMDFASGDSAMVYSTDLQNQRGNILDLSKEAQPFITGRTIASQSDIVALKNVVYSLNVEILMNPKTWQSEGPKWQRIYPRQGSFTLYDEDEQHPVIEITFDLNRINNHTR